jgi:hypothetical protein
MCSCNVDESEVRNESNVPRLYVYGNFTCNHYYKLNLCYIFQRSHTGLKNNKTNSNEYKLFHYDNIIKINKGKNNLNTGAK